MLQLVCRNYISLPVLYILHDKQIETMDKGCDD